MAFRTRLALFIASALAVPTVFATAAVLVGACHVPTQTLE